MLYYQSLLTIKINPHGASENDIITALDEAIQHIVNKGIATGRTSAVVVDYRIKTELATPEQVDELDEDDGTYWVVEYALRDCGAGGIIYSTGTCQVRGDTQEDARSEALAWVDQNDPKADASIDYGVDILTIRQHDEDDEHCGCMGED